MSVARAASDADKSAWPLLRSERTWGPLRLGIALATAAAATWCYLIGEYAGYYLNFVQGSLALTAGSMIGMLLVLLAAGPTCLRFGIDSVASTSSGTDEIRRPDSPSTTASSCPAMRVATAGVPHAAASVSVMPQPSRTDVEETTQARW